jgi:hypothetical protein
MKQHICFRLSELNKKYGSKNTIINHDDWYFNVGPEKEKILVYIEHCPFCGVKL